LGNTGRVCTAIGLRAGQWKNRGFDFRPGKRSFFSEKNVQTVIEAHLASDPMAAGVTFLGTIRPENEADYSSPTNIRLHMIDFMT